MGGALLPLLLEVGRGFFDPSRPLNTQRRMTGDRVTNFVLSVSRFLTPWVARGVSSPLRGGAYHRFTDCGTITLVHRVLLIIRAFLTSLFSFGQNLTIGGHTLTLHMPILCFLPRLLELLLLH